MQNRLTYYLILFFAVTFLSINAFVFADADFGWHLKWGEYINSNGLPKTDPFSYTMPSQIPVEHEWFFDVLISKLYPFVGFPGLSILMAVIALSAILLSIRNLDIKKLKLPIILLAVSSFQPFFTVSPKVFSWMFFALINLIILNKNISSKYWLLLIPIFAVWANLHGSFPLGLAVVSIVFLFKFKEKDIYKALSLVFSFLVTLINPYGTEVWELANNTSKNQLLLEYITEWQPAYLALTQHSMPLVFTLVLASVLIFNYRKHFKSYEIFIFITLVLATVLRVRFLHYLVIFTVPLMGNGLGILIKHFNENKESLARINKSLTFVTVVLMFFITYQIADTLRLGKTKYAFNNYYPVEAVGYLNKNLPLNNIFSEYEWGGYLVWKLPQKKVFIYGMMPVWENKNTPETESVNAFEDYLKLINAEDGSEDLINKYKIDTMLLANSEGKLQEYLRGLGWEITFKDKTAVIYIKK